MKRFALVLALAAAPGLLACVSPARPEITVYSKRDFTGARLTLREAYSDLDRDIPDVEDEISSFEIHRGVWEICKNPGYSDCRITSRSMPDLGAWDFDNAISSLRPVDEDAARGRDWDEDEYPYEDRYERRHDDD